MTICCLVCCVGVDEVSRKAFKYFFPSWTMHTFEKKTKVKQQTMFRIYFWILFLFHPSPVFLKMKKQNLNRCTRSSKTSFPIPNASIPGAFKQRKKKRFLWLTHQHTPVHNCGLTWTEMAVLVYPISNGINCFLCKSKHMMTSSKEARSMLGEIGFQWIH